MRQRAGYISPFALVIVATLAIVGLCVWLLGAGGRASAGAKGGRELVMYCAAGMYGPVKAVVEDYEKETGVKVTIEPGGSGTLLSKIRTTSGDHRADVYLAADRTYIDQARQYGVLAEAVPVASIRPVIVVARGNPKNIRQIADLLRDDVRVVLANPEQASIGKVTQTLLTRTGEWDALHARSAGSQRGVSFVGTVNEVADKVRVDAADAGIVWDSVARMFDVDLVEPESFRSATETVHVGVVAPGTDPTAALHFVRYLTAKDRGLKRFAEHGFVVDDRADVWADHPRVLLMSGAMLKPAIEDTITAFEKREGVSVERIYNGCGILVAQMKTGTQPEAYFSCDVSFMDEVADRFGPSAHVTRNPMVMIVPKGNPRGIKTLDDLKPDGLKIGLAHPQNSALGALTETMLVKLAIRDDVYRGSTVVHSDAGHMLVNQMVVGSLDAAVVYRSNAMASPDNGKRYDIVAIERPEAVAEQPFAVSRTGEHPRLMQRLLDALLAERRRFDEIGFIWIADEDASSDEPAGGAAR